MITVERLPSGKWRFTVEHPDGDQMRQFLPALGDEAKALRQAMTIWERWTA